MAQADVATPCRGGSYCYAGGTSDAGYGRNIEYPGVFTFSGGGRTNLSAGGGNYPAAEGTTAPEAMASEEAEAVQPVTATTVSEN